MKLTCVVLLVAISVVLGDSVIELTDSDFEGAIKQHDTILVMFYAPWCGHCKKLKPEYEKASDLLAMNDPPVALAKVDCTEAGKETCGKFGVSGYPTLKIFKGGELATEYAGPREANGLVKYMKSQVGAAAKEYKTVKDAEDHLAKPEVTIVGFFTDDESLKKKFLKLADKMRETVNFGYSSESSVLKKYGHTDAIVLYRPTHLQTKLEDSQVVFTGTESELEAWINDNYFGLVGHRTPDNAKMFKSPIIIAYYSVDYVKNIKGTNYWRNRIMKVAKSYSDKVTFAIASKDDFQHELNEFGIDYTPGDKPQICGRDKDDKKFVMSEEFSVETFETWVKDFVSGSLPPYLKSEPIPEQTEAVKVAVAKNFDELVRNSDKDILIEFYAPWCGHCKKLAPVYDEVAEALVNEDVELIKMDATANDVPSDFVVQGFPTLYFIKKGESPVPYKGGREKDDFIKFLAKSATNEMNGYDRQGKPRKKEL